MLLIHQLFVAGDEAGGTRHWELARHLMDAGHRVTVVADRSSYLTGKPHRSGDDPGGRTAGRADARSEESRGPVVHRVRCIGGGSSFVGRIVRFVSFTLASFARGLFVRDVDVVYGTTPPLPQAVTAMALARLRRVPFLLEVRDLWPDFAVELGVLRSPLLISVARRLERTLYRAADLVVPNSPGFVEHLRASGAQSIEVVPNGVDPDGFDPSHDGAAFRSRHGLEGKFLVVYAGAHGVPNDLGTVLDAAEMMGAGSDAVFVLVGDGRDKARLVEEAGRRSIANVVFVDPLPKSAMRDVLAAMDVGLATLRPLPLFRTVYPNKVFDYMAAGRPTILQIDGVIRTVVEEADAGLFVPPGDAAALAAAVRHYRTDSDARHRQGASAREAVERGFRRSDHARSMADHFTRLVGGDSR